MAEGKRDSLENVVFDPILLGIYMIERKHVLPAVFGLPENWAVKDIIYDVEKLQTFSEKVANYILDEETNADTLCEYVSDIKINIADKYLKLDGHDLEKLIFSKFEELRHLKHPQLKTEIVKYSVQKYPQFIPIEFLELFDNLQH